MAVRTRFGGKRRRCGIDVEECCARGEERLDQESPATVNAVRQKNHEFAEALADLARGIAGPEENWTTAIASTGDQISASQAASDTNSNFDTRKLPSAIDECAGVYESVPCHYSDTRDERYQVGSWCECWPMQATQLLLTTTRTMFWTSVSSGASSRHASNR